MSRSLPLNVGPMSAHHHNPTAACISRARGIQSFSSGANRRTVVAAASAGKGPDPEDLVMSTEDQEFWAGQMRRIES